MNNPTASRIAEDILASFTDRVSLALESELKGEMLKLVNQELDESTSRWRPIDSAPWEESVEIVIETLDHDGKPYNIVDGGWLGEGRDADGERADQWFGTELVNPNNQPLAWRPLRTDVPSQDELDKLNRRAK